MRGEGIVDSYDPVKSIATIVRDRGADIFVHHVSIIAEGVSNLSKGDRVSFDVIEGPKGLQAKNVVKIS